MCGRIDREIDDFYDQFHVYYGEVRPPTPVLADMHRYFRQNISPTTIDLHLRDTDEGRVLVPSYWGLWPGWAKDKSMMSKTFNARSESLLERSSFKNLVGKRRCVIPVTAFYEWRQSSGKGKEPLYIHRQDKQQMLLAGLWTERKDDETGEPVFSHTIITCEPNRFMSSIHNRMPVVLEPDAVDEWLAAENTKPADVLPLLRPCADDVLTAYRVSTLVNNTRHQGPELIAPLPPD